ncbi:MAG: 2-oxoglutarate dehydrogenase E1 component [Gemmatimonadales bacterium]|nr:MAG: 2-oxoglutarate dehydrogenase E1 component [Gemmatimonadales bacterium]
MSISSLFDGYNAGYVQDLFEEYSRNPRGVPDAWRDIFSSRLDELVAAGLLVPDGHRENGRQAVRVPVSTPTAEAGAAAPGDVPEVEPSREADPPLSSPGGEVGPARQEDDRVRLLPLIARAAALIQAFRDHGHQLATIDPLGSEPPGHPQLDPAFFGTSMDELGEVPTSLVMDGAGDEPLSQTLARLQSIYCGSIGYQFEHLEDPERVQWLWETVESRTHARELDTEEKRRLLDRLSEVEGLEAFLHRTYLGQKRFSIEGTDMMVPMLDEAIRLAREDGGDRMVMGMAHRGRLNVLCHILGVEYRALLREFEGAPQEDAALSAPGTGDVKYHHGATGRYELPDGEVVEVTLAPNPSHLEFVNPVVQGMARALQFDGPEADGDRDGARVVPVLIHGDAAFAAEGVVAESLNLARLRGYSVGGTVHIIANNQVGFTTDPDEGRSTRYASDLAKGYDIPVVHVNADDPQACLDAIRLAMAYRKRFGDDMVIDLVGYRRHGHNEGDEPSYTQPTLYDRISEHPTVRTLFANRLVEEGVVEEDEAKAAEDRVTDILRSAQEDVKEEKESSGSDPFPPPPPEPEPVSADTPVSLEVLEEVNRDVLQVPEGFSIHPKLARQLGKRAQDFGADTPLNWAHAESLAFGSLVREGIPVRMSGQDSQRGTFSQRHLVLHDYKTGEQVLPLAEMGGSRFEIWNSPLSETGVMGFEYGHSVASGEGLVLWEAQFGDFVNVAQPILDQFLASGHTKWGQLSSLTLLLPHGYEGQGPEHSSARLERFLQMCAEDNMRVAYPTTPAQYFHLLRRQALATPPRPLVVMTPKSLLRHPKATSPVSALVEGSFRPVLPDPVAEGKEEKVTRLLLCSGKVFHDILTSEGREEMEHVAVARIEELYPFPAGEVEALLERYPATEEVVWVQEEPRNMGALTYVGPLLRAAIPREIPLRHVSRPARASPSEGRSSAHEAKQAKVVAQALGTWED